jgi:hypothetical protein
MEPCERLRKLAEPEFFYELRENEGGQYHVIQEIHHCNEVVGLVVDSNDQVLWRSQSPGW